MARGDTYTQQYSDFVGVDLSRDPREVARNRLAYSVNMWRDYESEQGAAIETFPGFRRVADNLGKINGIYGYRDMRGKDYVIVHGGNSLYCYDHETGECNRILSDHLEDSDSTGFVYNNKLYIQDGTNYVAVSGVVSGDTTAVTAEDVKAYVPTTYYNGAPYEQRNMLVNEAYEKTTTSSMEDIPKGRFWYDLFIRSGDPTYAINGFAKGSGYKLKTPYVYCEMNVPDDSLDDWVGFSHDGFANESIVKVVDADLGAHNICFQKRCFQNCANLESITLYTGRGSYDRCHVFVEENAFEGCKKLKQITVNIDGGGYLWLHFGNIEDPNALSIELFPGTTIAKEYPNIPDGVEIIVDGKWSDNAKVKSFAKRNKVINSYDVASSVIDVRRTYDNQSVEFEFKCEPTTISGDEVWRVTEVRVAEEALKYKKDKSNAESEMLVSDVEILYELNPLHFSTIKDVSNFYDGNTDYRGTGIDAIMKCTKNAVYDGRIFLTGNPELPNTVFFSQRNITGANDPTYFGAYNYMNDGDGNSPNVDLLATPSMLMVLKNTTVQDGSVYYHVATDNPSEDQTTRNLLPRIYPSTSGVAGLGCVGNTVPGSVSCNFLDDPVFLSTRGLEAVGKQTVNLERTLTHRSSNVDRLLIKEDLAKASITEWKGYLVICCNGHVYLADSRTMSQHEDGSYQYEWYYLEGIGSYEWRNPRYRYLTNFLTDENGVSIGDYVSRENPDVKAKDVFKVRDDRYIRNNGDLELDAELYIDSSWKYDGKTKTVYYVDGEDGKYLIDQVDEEMKGGGSFYGAKKTFASGDLLFFGNDDGVLFIVNTDKRGVPDYEGQNIEHDRISREWYTFDGIAYESLCSLRLDDCGRKALAKNTVSGTTVARFKMMPGSACQAMISLNGRDWKPLGRAVASRFDANDIDFSTFAFAENEDEIAVLPELTRGWVMKQYLFKSGGFKKPFGLYELSYLYYVKGKIRR